MGHLKKLLSVKAVRYLISSCAAFLADYAVFLALDRLLAGASVLSMELSAVISFAISSQINFWINRRWVFGSDKPPLPELGGYYSLAGVSFCVKTFLLLELFVRVIKLPKALAKPLCECVMFAVNYIVQKKIIFKKREKEPKTKKP